MTPNPPEQSTPLGQTLRVLMVEHSKSDVELCLRELKNAGFEIRADIVETPEEYTERLRADSYDIILADYRLPFWTAKDALALMRELGKDIPFILVTGMLGEEAAVECVKQGVTDYVLKQRLSRLSTVIPRALEEHRQRAERRRVEQGLRDSEARYRVVAETATDAFITINSESRILFVNAAAERIFGYTRAEMLGQELTLFMPESFRQQNKAGLKRSLETGQIYTAWESVELTGLHKSGASIPLEVSFGEFLSDGEHTFTGIVRDITERKRAQESLQLVNDLLSARVAELEQLNRDMTLVNQMGELLQTCVRLEEAYAVFGQTAPELFAAESGALYVLDAVHNLVESVAVWGDAPPGEPVFAPGDCWALRRGQAHGVESSDAGLVCQHLGQSHSRTSLCVPMMAQGEALGVLLLHSGPGESGQPVRLGASRQRLALNVAEHLGLALANLRLREALQDQSIHDPLTGLFNRRYMEESLERELRRALREQRTLGLIMLDLDHFKQFNDTYGHEAGDALLRELGHLLQARIRKEDIACRYGGEEFVLVLPEASLEVTRRRAEQLRESFKSLTVRVRGQNHGAGTVSLGVAGFPEHGATFSALLRVADAALYRAKNEGRDRVIVGQPAEADEAQVPSEQGPQRSSPA